MANTEVKKTESNNESEVDKQENQAETTRLKNDIGTIDIGITIERKIRSIDFMRRICIQLSNRLESYSRKWKFIFFFINVEAVIIVLLSLTNTIETMQIGQFNMSFDLISGIFTLYVILLQYYVNILNYNERALRVHYHQLELEDLNQQLRMLSLKMNVKEVDMREIEIINNYDRLVDQYQLAVKNNENHRKLDYERTKYKRKSNDFTLNIALIYANTLLSVVMFFVIFYVIIF